MHPLVLSPATWPTKDLKCKSFAPKCCPIEFPRSLGALNQSLRPLLSVADYNPWCWLTMKEWETRCVHDTPHRLGTDPLSEFRVGCVNKHEVATLERPKWTCEQVKRRNSPERMTNARLFKDDRAGCLLMARLLI